MKYEQFLEHYVPELQVLDALDELKNYSLDAAKTIDRWVSQSSNAKNDATFHQMDPNY